jgi:hypothetical protein
MLLCAAAGAAAAFATPASATQTIVQPCHGTSYNHGAVVTNPTNGRQYRLCIEQ